MGCGFATLANGPCRLLSPAPLREVLAVIQAGLSGSVGGHVFSFAALGCLVVVVLSPAPGRAALWSHAVCPAASSAPRGAFAYSVYPLRGLETVSRAARCRSLRAAIAHGQLLRNLRSDRRSAHLMPFCLAWVNCKPFCTLMHNYLKINFYLDVF